MRKYLEVSGVGSAAATPDRLDLHLSVTALSPGIAAALAEVDQRVRDLGIALRELGVDPGDLRTTSSSVYEEYAGPENIRAGFRASQDLTVRIADLDRISDVLSAALGATGDSFRLNHVAWDLAEDAEVLRQARQAAVSDARAKASELADLVGAELGELLRITESSGSAGPATRFAAAKADAGGFAPERGTHQVEVAVQVRWALA